MKLTIGEEYVIVRGLRPEEQHWGTYQFPRPYNLGDRFVVGVHVADDDIKSFGETNRWFESRDGGVTWNEIDAAVATQCGLLLQNGDRIYFPMESGISLSNYTFASPFHYNPDYDFSKKAEEGTLPLPDGFSHWIGGTEIKAYNADRLPPSLSKKEWLAMRTPAGQTKPVEEHVKVDWPYLTRVVHSHNWKDPILKPIFPRGNLKIGPDGAICRAVFNKEASC